MKYALILTVLAVAVLSGTTYANALLVAETPLELYYHHELILVGKVISLIENSDGITIQYDIKVEEYVKNPKPYDMISVVGIYGTIPSSPEFDVGDRVLLLLNKEDGRYQISPLSFKAQTGCDSHQLLGMQTFPDEPLARGQPQGEFKIDKDCFGPMEMPSGFWAVSPLKQFKSGIPTSEIKCKQDLQLVIKARDGSPACVKPETKIKLIEHGWAESTEPTKVHDGTEIVDKEFYCAWVGVHRLSDHDLQIRKQNIPSLRFLQVTDDDLKELPKLKQMIDAVNDRVEYNHIGRITISSAEWYTYYEFLEKKFVEQYDKAVPEWFEPDLKYNEKKYAVGYESSSTSYRLKAELIPDLPSGITPELQITEEDMAKLPKIKEAIDQIGTYEISPYNSTGLPELEQRNYMKWFESKYQEQYGNVARTYSDYHFQYDDKYYDAGFTIC
ncbi:MAG: hypothetical protein ACREAE_00780 [Nitrosopumilaceae archaeon]